MLSFKNTKKNISKKRVLLVIVSIGMCMQVALSQSYSSTDIGLFIGTSQYNGDVNMTRPYYSPNLSLALHFRKTYNYRYAWRNSFSYGSLKGFDKDFINPYQKLRNHSFRSTHIFELASLVEFNFFNVSSNEKDNNFSPYIAAGVGVFYSPEIPLKEALCIPAGIGLKYKINSQIEITTEWLFRKTNTNRLDQLYVDNFERIIVNQFTSGGSKDWYSLLGVTILFTFLNDNSPCHTYQRKNYETYIKKRNNKR